MYMILTSKLNSNPNTTTEIIKDFDKDIINRLGYKKEKGKLYKKTKI